MNALLDGYRGGLTYLDGRWQGYLDNLDCVIDMEGETDIHKVSIRFMQLIGPGVFQPGQVELLTSEDGENFIPAELFRQRFRLMIRISCFRNIYSMELENPLCSFESAEGESRFYFADEIVVW